MLNTKNNQKQFHEFKMCYKPQIKFKFKKVVFIDVKTSEQFWCKWAYMSCQWCYWYVMNIFLTSSERFSSKIFTKKEQNVSNKYDLNVCSKSQFSCSSNLSTMIQSFVFIVFFFGICKKQPFWKCIFDIGPIKVTYLYDFSSFGKLDV